MALEEPLWSGPQGPLPSGVSRHCPPGLGSLTSVCLGPSVSLPPCSSSSRPLGLVDRRGGLQLALVPSTLPTPATPRHSVRATPDLSLEPQAGVQTLLNISPPLSCVNTLPVPRAQSCLTPCDPVDCSPPGSSVQGILQARILEWVVISFSRGASQSFDQDSANVTRTELPLPRPTALPQAPVLVTDAPMFSGARLRDCGLIGDPPL